MCSHIRFRETVRIVRVKRKIYLFNRVFEKRGRRALATSQGGAGQAAKSGVSAEPGIALADPSVYELRAVCI